jgi:GNAT superfamily N-acetyltransferase
MPLRLRPANGDDNAALLELTRVCPMEGDIALRIDRSPDFFALSRCRGAGWTIVAEADGRIVGCASVSRRPAYVGGRPTVMGHVGDIKVRPGHRRAGVARRLLDEIARVEQSSDAAFYAATTAAGNAAVDGLVLDFGTDRTVSRIATFVSRQLLPLARARVDRSFAIAHGSSADEEELAALLDQAHGRYTFGPVFRDGAFRELLARSPGMQLSDYLVARRRGRIVAALGVWDQHAFKQTELVGLPRLLRWLTTAARIGGRPLGLPALPSEGEPLRFRYVRHPAHLAGEAEALAALVRHALGSARERREHFLLFTCAEGDPIERSTAGLPRTTYRYDLVVGKNRPWVEDDLGALASALPFDDAALA